MKSKLLDTSLILLLMGTSSFNSNILIAKAQVVPDSTLPVNSRTDDVGPTTLISGGTERGTNLFHSFSRFSVNSGQSAIFNSSPRIRNIFSRVSGNSSSTIDGGIVTGPSVNLFFLNSNGILFGPNASLLVGGSFLASTADSVRFFDNSEFRTNSSFSSLSAVEPIALTYSQSSGPIEVQGPGHNLINPGGPPIIGAFTQPLGLAVAPGNSITLAGNGINFLGGILTNRSGNINVVSVGSGELAIDTNGNQLSLGINARSSFSDISLRERSLINGSGDGASNIKLFGDTISLFNGSVALNQHAGSAPADSVEIQASNRLFINGTDPVARITSGVFVEAVGLSGGGDINLSSPIIEIINGGVVQTYSYTDVPGGDINVDASNSVQLIGSSPRTPSAFSTISTATISPFSSNRSRAGRVSVETSSLTVLDGAVLGSINGGVGTGGDVFVKARDINIRGVQPIIFSPATITTSAFRAGNAGNVLINTETIRIANGGRVDSSTLAAGDAGTVTINASNLIGLDGTVPGVINPSLISSSATVLDEDFNSAFPAPIFTPIGNAGGVTLNTNQLLVSNGARVSVQNDGAGNAGDLRVNADQINLINEGGLSAATESGNGGNILIESKLLNLRNGEISASARGTGIGGNIEINSPLIVGFGDSLISANSEQSTGGRINIETLGIFGPNFAITATSDLGPQFDGQVEIDTENRPVAVDQIEVRQPTNTAVKLNCSPDSSGAQSSFAIRGTGGFPSQASNFLQNAPVLSRGANPEKAVHLPFMLDKQSGKKIYLAEPQGFIRHKDGTLAFTIEAQGSYGRSNGLVSSACLNIRAAS